ncbi:hypothetical protein C9374_003784 [Naegleria lovaniensis]|uniref:Protein transport protein SEC23 n=1 Tax=Naegleria lovaniensis TaxID=51637 RepID=A0AA88H3M6_NAELO|nr:uncharacterized protein C9374_003784 [Naegleria lovaniensis]KAG2394020.1 hypothetical protein C9374_003784 [Naegleria lovaniensis]
MDFTQSENSNGIRHSWNILPANRLDQSRCIVPVGSLYTPLKEIPNLVTLPYEPVVCKTCRGILNPFAKVDYRTKSWVCPLCMDMNMFPQAYSGITETQPPAELHTAFTTIEYKLVHKPPAPAPVFLLLVDTCLPEDEMRFLKDSILQSLNIIPDNSLVGLITYGATVQVFELGFKECSKAYVFRGDKETPFEQVQDQLGLKLVGVQQFGQNRLPNQQMPSNATSKFLCPISECPQLMDIIEELQPDPWPVKSGRRPRRCTGVALSVATSLLESTFKGYGARIINFIGGPCTFGDGQVVGLDLIEQIRLHNDLRNGKAPHFKKATEFYKKIAQRLVQNGHVLDIFAANLDQVGVLEMKACCENAGGVMVLTDTFDNPIFKESYMRYFETDANDQLKMALNATIELQCSNEVKICGVIGPVTSMNRKGNNVTENIIGEGNTNAWKINAIHPNTTLAFYFDVVNQQNPASMNTPAIRCFQYITAYQHPSGEYRLRVTTQALGCAQPNRFDEIAQGFDQEAATALVARLSVFKAESEYLFDVLRWLDRSLIKLVSKFGSYQPNDPNSLILSPQFSIFPQFLYHLRRSQFLRVFNSSPDETAWFRLILNRETTTNSITMIQPTLYSYSFTEPPHPVELDSNSVKPDVILLLDTFFAVLIHYGETIASWREAGYHTQPKYENFAKLLELPKEDAKLIIKDRFPYPRYIECDQGSSQARFLIAKINPSTTHKDQAYGQNSTVVLTDDAAMQAKFILHQQQKISTGVIIVMACVGTTSASTNIRVCVRCRPFIANELKDNSCPKTLPFNIEAKSIEIPNIDPTQTKVFPFDFVFDEKSENNDLYREMISDMIPSVVNGVNVTTFAYGQTSSGKTYTMRGGEENPGLIRLAIREIFNQIKNSECENRTFLIRVSYLEIYNEKVRDLLSPEQRFINIFVDKNKNLSFDHLTEEIVRSENEAMDVLARGSSHVIIAKTVANDASSRSHTIFRMIVERKDEIALDNSTTAQTKKLNPKQILRIGTLTLVDLAGSENASLQVDDNRKREGQNINLSLLHLKEIISKLANGEKVSSFRNSKLTRILGDSLSGNARVAVICCISPEEAKFRETKRTLEFGSNARRIVIKPTVNSECDNALIMKYQTELESLQNELALLREKLKNQKDDVDKEETEEEVKNLENVVKELTDSMITNKSLLIKLEDVEKEKRDRDAKIIEIEKEKQRLELMLKLEEEKQRIQEEESRNKDQVLLQLQQETLAMNIRLEEISLSKKEWESQSQRKEIQIKELMDYNRIIEEKMINEENSRKKAEHLVQDQIAQIELFKQKNELIANEYAKEKKAKEEACNLVQEKLHEMQNIQHLLRESENEKANYESQLKILNDNMSTMYSMWKEDFENEMRLKDKEKSQLDEQIARLTRIFDEKELEIRELQEQLKTSQLLQQNILSFEREAQLYKKLLQESENEKEMIKKKSLESFKENLELKKMVSSLEKELQMLKGRRNDLYQPQQSNSSESAHFGRSRPTSPVVAHNFPSSVQGDQSCGTIEPPSSLSNKQYEGDMVFNLYGYNTTPSQNYQPNPYNQAYQQPAAGNSQNNPFNHSIHGMRDDSYQPIHHNPYESHQFYPPTNPSYGSNSSNQLSFTSNGENQTYSIYNGPNVSANSRRPSPLTNRSALSMPQQDLPSTNAISGRARPKLFHQQSHQSQPQTQAKVIMASSPQTSNQPIRNPSPSRIIRITGERASPKETAASEESSSFVEPEQEKVKLKKRRSSLSNLFGLFKSEDKANLLK